MVVVVTAAAAAAAAAADNQARDLVDESWLVENLNVAPKA